MKSQVFIFSGGSSWIATGESHLCGPQLSLRWTMASNSWSSSMHLGSIRHSIKKFILIQLCFSECLKKLEIWPWPLFILFKSIGWVAGRQNTHRIWMYLYFQAWGVGQDGWFYAFGSALECSCDKGWTTMDKWQEGLITVIYCNC